jgi:hypothetical protein
MCSFLSDLLGKSLRKIAVEAMRRSCTFKDTGLSKDTLNRGLSAQGLIPSRRDRKQKQNGKRRGIQMENICGQALYEI